MAILHIRESMMKTIVWSLVLVLCVTACGNGNDAPATPSVEQIYTQIALEVSAGLTQTAAAKPQVVPSAPPQNAPVPTIGENPTIAAASTMAGGGPTIAPLPGDANPSPESLVPTDAVPIVTQEDPDAPKCKYRALLGYESPKDDTWIMEKKSFKRIWEFANTGDCTWPVGMTLRYVSGEMFDSEGVQTITDTVTPPGEHVRVETSMRAPDLSTGTKKVTLQGNWMLATPDGHLFGSGTDGKGYFWVSLVICEEKTCKEEDEE